MTGPVRRRLMAWAARGSIEFTGELPVSTVVLAVMSAVWVTGSPAVAAARTRKGNGRRSAGGRLPSVTDCSRVAPGEGRGGHPEVVRAAVAMSGRGTATGGRGVQQRDCAAGQHEYDLRGASPSPACLSRIVVRGLTLTPTSTAVGGLSTRQGQPQGTGGPSTSAHPFSKPPGGYCDAAWPPGERDESSAAHRKPRLLDEEFGVLLDLAATRYRWQ